MPNSLLNFIGGEFVPPARGAFLENVNPATGCVFGRLPDSDASDVNRAVEAARNAFPSWRDTPREKRAALLNAVANGIEARREEFARAETRDQGKPLSLARSMDIPRAIENFRFFAGALLHEAQEALESGASHSSALLSYTTRGPLGVAGLVTPWNLPLYLLTWKIAPALATGNTAVCKPSEFTSTTAFLLAEVMRDAGIPPGVCNVVFGRGETAGEALVVHPHVPLVSFTGGTGTGAHIAHSVASSFKKLSLELGGKNANLVFADADLDLAARTSVRSSFLNQGEICLCGSRIYVEESIFDSFLERFVAQTRKLVVGDPENEKTTLGALVSAEHRAKVESYFTLAREEGAHFVCGGKRPTLPGPFQNGFFLEPTILTGVAHSSRLQQEEIFGPIVTVTPFRHEAEALFMANDVRFGLSASVWTNDLSRAHRVAHALDVGTVWVNAWLARDLRAPFGGMKASGLGREGGRHSLEFYTETKTIALKWDKSHD
ncbi:MAG: aldehyde dehydrogenase [Silvanigrellales bacterium]|jgi:aminomuconate-semialdehyde/2-hydroxymuconate-6-semialdehyde dehydrogenase|nr:aldehyde dehydrogenase [Silvanigrellales bacterium]